MHCSCLQLGRHFGFGRFLEVTTKEVLEATIEEVRGSARGDDRGSARGEDEGSARGDDEGSARGDGYDSLYAVEQERCAVWGGRLWGGHETSRGSERADNGVRTLK